MPEGVAMLDMSELLTPSFLFHAFSSCKERKVFIELNHIKKCNTVRGVFVLEEFGNYIILILGLYSHGSNSNFQSSDSELHCNFRDGRECRLHIRSCLRDG